MQIFPYFYIPMLISITISKDEMGEEQERMQHLQLFDIFSLNYFIFHKILFTELTNYRLNQSI